MEVTFKRDPPATHRHLYPHLPTSTYAHGVPDYTPSHITGEEGRASTLLWITGTNSNQPGLWSASVLRIRSLGLLSSQNEKEGGWVFNCWKGIDSFQAPFPSTQSIYQLQASSYPDIKAGNCPWWHPTRTAYLQASITADPLSWFLITGFWPNAFVPLSLPLDLAPGVSSSYQIPLQTHTGQAVSWSLFHLPGKEEAVWPLGSLSVLLNITTAEACG